MATNVKATSRKLRRLGNVRRVEVEQDPKIIRAMSFADKLRHSRACILNALLQVAKEEHGRGQPGMIERLIKASAWVDELEASGIPFSVSREGKMNKEVRKLLVEEARNSTDPRKSRTKEIGADAVRVLLRKVRKLRIVSSITLRYPPYAD